jgi:hypothetical protein
MANIDTSVFAEVAPKVISGILFGALIFWGVASTICRSKKDGSKKDVRDDVNDKLKDKQR